jgi:hypothetical protein
VLQVFVCLRAQEENRGKTNNKGRRFGLSKKNYIPTLLRLAKKKYEKKKNFSKMGG